jgi:succinoglycan biosynthesis protein ExoM
MKASVRTGADRPRIAVAVCTYNRPGPLAVLLDALIANARTLIERVSVGVVVVDDSADGNARQVVERFIDRFELGAVYRISGRHNIALARNMALEAGIEMADWVAITDDDCEPAADWLEVLHEVRQRTGADAVTGVLRRRVPAGSPRWITEQPFLDLGRFEDVEDEQEVSSAATHNSMLSSQWLREHPHIRFDPELGVTGGEDPVFYRAAHAAGLRIRYSLRAIVYENEPASRATLGYQLRTYFWHGNSSYITSIRAGVQPLKMFLHGGRLIVQGLSRPFACLADGKQPQFRYGVAVALRGAGMMTGPLGLKVQHK